MTDLRIDAQFENATAYIDNVAASGVAAALKIVGIFLRPQAVLIDSSGADDTRFIREIQVQASDMDLSVIALPQHTGTELAWITRLDSQALKGKTAG